MKTQNPLLFNIFSKSRSCSYVKTGQSKWAGQHIYKMKDISIHWLRYQRQIPGASVLNIDMVSSYSDAYTKPHNCKH